MFENRFKKDKSGATFKRTDIINYCVSLFGFEYYLEIGYGDGQNYKNVRCKNKKVVDPFKSAPCIKMYSDDFFNLNKEKFDLIFIDGDHSCKQVLKDVENSIKFLNENGIILMHDCNPPTKRHEAKDICGDSWKTIPLLRKNEGIDTCVIDTDLGIGVVKLSGNRNVFKNSEINQDNFDKLEYSFLEKDRVSVLNLLPIDQFFNWINND